MTLVQSGDIFACRDSSLLDRVIRDVSGETWDHIGVIWQKPDGSYWALQAMQGHGVEAVPLAQLLPFDLISVGKPLSAQALGYAQGQMGKSYSYIDAALAGIDIAPIAGGHICSEFAARVLVENSVLAANWATRGVTPGELVEALLNAEFSLKRLVSLD